MDDGADARCCCAAPMRSQGYTDGELARAVRRTELRRLQRGTYVLDAAGLPTEAGPRHRLTVAATIGDLRSPAVVSHVSAAAVPGLALWGHRLDRVHVIRQPPASGSSSARSRLHLARIADDEVTVVGGMVVTTVTRTVVDLARTASVESAVVTADLALRARLTSPDALAASLRAVGGAPGTRRAAHVLRFADGLSESVGESRSRVALERLGLPAPDLQPRTLRRRCTGVGACRTAQECGRPAVRAGCPPASR